MFDGESPSVTQLVIHEELLLDGRGREATAPENATARVFASDEALFLEPRVSPCPTRVNGEPLVAKRPLCAGDSITMGGAALVVHKVTAPVARRTPVTPAELARQLAGETERALRYGRPLAVVAIDVGTAESDHGRVERALGASLRVADVLAWLSERELVLVLPETDEASTNAPAERIMAALAPLAPGARAGLAVCPHDGCDPDTLLRAARTARDAHDVEKLGPQERVATLSDAAHVHKVGEANIVVVEPAMKRLFATIDRVAASDLPVLVTGETGVGKEVVAGALHAGSKRSSGPLVCLNCAAVPDNLLESQLFGHERGAFTGAIAAKPGVFELADHGTLFLDEVGELSPSAQAKLLRVLETRVAVRVGGVAERALDVRVIAATNRNLELEVSAGRFREDLYFRLCAATVFVPPLRDRRLDLPVLARSFLQEACIRADRPPMTIDPNAMQRLLRWRWPGNVRELKNAMGYVAAVCTGDVLEMANLPERLTAGMDWSMRPPAEGGPEARLSPSIPAAASPGLSAYPSHATPASPAGARPPRAAPKRSGEFRMVYDEIRELERMRMVEALEAAGGVRVRAADLIGMPLRTFVTKLKEYGIGQAPARRRPLP